MVTRCNIFPISIYYANCSNNKSISLYFVGMDGNVLLIPKYGVSLYKYFTNLANDKHSFELRTQNIT